MARVLVTGFSDGLGLTAGRLLREQGHQVTLHARNAARAAAAGATVSGEYFYHQQLQSPHPATRDPSLQDQRLAHCASLSGLTLPPAPEQWGGQTIGLR